MGPFQISDAPFQGNVILDIDWFLTSFVNQIWAHESSCSSEKVRLDIHGVVRRER